MIPKTDLTQQTCTCSKSIIETLEKVVKTCQACNFNKKRLQHRCFPVNIVKFLTTVILKNIFKRLLLNFRMKALALTNCVFVHFYERELFRYVSLEIFLWRFWKTPLKPTVRCIFTKIHYLRINLVKFIRRGIIAKCRSERIFCELNWMTTPKESSPKKSLATSETMYSRVG